VTRRSALVTGGTKGLGRRTALRLVQLGYDVILTGRSTDEAAGAADDVGASYRGLDVCDPADIERTVRALEAEGVGLDVLVNNAAVMVEDPPLEIDELAFGTQMATNVYGPWLLMRAFVPWMIDRGYGRVVNVSSECGSFGSGGPTEGSYGVSKAALNALTVTVAAQIPADVDVLINSVDPGWARTDMGGPEAPRSIEDGAEGIVWAATLPPGGPRGGFFRDGKPFPW
jgi:NAD(P)-dependent dehydrogenase (short-subunit alcohol dehydrogenase family)